MGKLVIRIGWCGFAIACALSAASRWMGRSAPLDRLEIALWPMSILPYQRMALSDLSFLQFLAIGFSVLMNGAYYAGLAWLLWSAARLAGIVKTMPSAKARFISLFLGIGLIFSLLVAAAEVAIHWPPQLAAPGLREVYLISANLFAMNVLTCACSGWALWWLRGFFTRRAAGPPPS